MANMTRYRSNKRNIIYEDLQEDEVIVKDLVESSQDLEVKMALGNLLKIIKLLKEQV